MFRLSAAMFAGASLAIAMPTSAQDQPPAPAAAPAPGAANPFERAMAPMVPRDAASSRRVETDHSVTIRGRKIAYRAIVGEFPMPGADGTDAAVAVTFAYIAAPARGAGPRPVIFAYNGGPGASSLPLHMRGIGPRRIAGEGASSRMVDNPESLLDVADLVFIDPVGTGASMPIRGKDASSYWSVRGDARAVLAIVQRWSAANGRADAPKFLMGESYGTTRTVAALNEPEAARINLKGVVLVSLSLGGTGALVESAITQLPTFAAIAWYHNRVDRAGRTAEEHYRAALAFAQGPYAAAVIAGDTLDPAARHDIAGRTSALIGLSPEAIEANGLIVPAPLFMRELLGNGMRTGQLDARATRAIAESQQRPPFDDPSMTFTTDSQQVERYITQELKFALPSPYRSLNLGINMKWTYDRDYGGGYDRIDLGTVVRKAARQMPGLKIMSIGGIYDITTPAYAGNFVLDHAGIPAERRTSRVYPSGHSVFEDMATMPVAANDVRAFIGAAHQAGRE